MRYIDDDTVTGAPAGENTSLAGTEYVPISGNQVTAISSIAAYIRTLVQTLTGKTINLTDNTLTGTKAQFNTAMSDADFATLTGTETLTNKTVALGSNTVSGTTAQFNTANTDGDFATIAGSETLTNKTLTAPTMADFTNAQHDHGDADDGGAIGIASAEYLTSAAHAGLSAEVVIPGMAGQADRAGIGGAGVSYEFDSGGSPLTWSAAVDTETVDSTIPSHLYIADNGAAETLGLYDWAPAGAFDLRCKISLGMDLGTGAGEPGAGLTAGDTTMANRVYAQISYLGTADNYRISMFTYASSTFTLRGAANIIGGQNFAYLRIVRDGSNNNTFYYSMDGLTWLLVATQALTYTAAKAGLRVAAASVVTTVAVDWIRSDV